MQIEKVSSFPLWILFHLTFLPTCVVQDSHYSHIKMAGICLLLLVLAESETGSKDLTFHNFVLIFLLWLPQTLVASLAGTPQLLKVIFALFEVWLDGGLIIKTLSWSLLESPFIAFLC